MTLIIRYGSIPGRGTLMAHLPAFSILFVVFIIINFSAGLYDKRSTFIRSRIQGTLFKAQIVNAVLGITLFYFAPVSIAPKANLFIYFAVSTALLLLWRMVMFPVVSVTRKQNALLVGSGYDIKNLYEEVDDNFRYGLAFKEHILPLESAEQTVNLIAKAVKMKDAKMLVVDLHNNKLEHVMPFLYSLVFSGIQITDASKLYEAVFDRIPLSMVRERWLVENSHTALGSRRTYDLLKRLMDIVIASVIGVFSLLMFPFIYIAIKLDDKGDIFITQERVGKNGKLFRMTKYRSMTANDGGVYDKENNRSELKVTRVGKFIRLTRIDELPQLWSVLKGNQSLIGPRPELPALANVYEKEIPYYNVRHLIKPGLSGWAQIYHRAHPHHSVAVEDTRDKLSYDLYYIKNRSLLLDLRIALQTVKALFSRQGV